MTDVYDIIVNKFKSRIYSYWLWSLQLILGVVCSGECRSSLVTWNAPLALCMSTAFSWVKNSMYVGICVLCMYVCMFFERDVTQMNTRVCTHTHS